MPEIELTKKQEAELLTKGLFSSPFFTIVASVVATFVIAYFFTKVGGRVPITLTTTQVEKMHTFDVSGEGRAQATPDVARAAFGITARETSVTAAQSKVNNILAQLKQDFKKLGVEERDFRTISYNINPEYSPEGGRQITGYNVSSQVEVTFRNFAILERAFDAAANAGANLVGGLSFEFSQEIKTGLEDEARKEAIEEAKKKAEKIARETGLGLGRIVNVQENKVQEPPFFRAVQLQAEEETPTEISPGVSEVRIKVTLSYETK